MYGFYSAHQVNGAARACVKGTIKQDIQWKCLSLAESAGECAKRLVWTMGYMDRGDGDCEVPRHD